MSGWLGMLIGLVLGGMLGFLLFALMTVAKRGDKRMESARKGGNMTNEEIENAPKDYIGNGVYVISDGHGIWLHANNHLNPTDRVYLEAPLIAKLSRFAERVGIV